MIVRIDLHNKLVTTVAAFLLISVCLFWLLTLIIKEFVIGTLADNRYRIEQTVLQAGVKIFPDSGKLFARLAQIENNKIDADPLEAETYAAAAVAQSANDYNNRLLLASIKDSHGDQTGAENNLREALILAPHYSDVHWRIANLLIREGKTDEALDYFQTAVRLNPALVDPTLDLLWNVAGGTDAGALNKIAENNPRAQLALARFLVKQNRIADAAEILATVDRRTALESWEIPQIIYTLVGKNYPCLARELWFGLMTDSNDSPNDNLIWNGDFERHNVKNFEHFDWHLSHTDFARISIDDKESRSGASSLLIDFTGRDTTVLNLEVKQQTAVAAGAAYRLDFFVKTEDFRSPEGPRVVVSDLQGKWNVSSSPIATGTNDWHRVTFEFIAPRTAFGVGVSLLVSIKRQPKFSYDEPTRGRIWFDDFSLSKKQIK